MNYNSNWLIQKIDNGEKVKYLFFWGHQPSKDGSVSASCFSQWWLGSPFLENGISYKSTEHYMMAGKAKLFGDSKIVNKIIDAESPAEAKKLGRLIQGFDQAKWEKHRCEIVIQGNFLKFSQHENLRQFLLNSSNRILVESSPVDNVWGIGMHRDDKNVENPKLWKGPNLLGFCLMEVREKLQK